MLILILFAFVGGIVTILSPCTLPILPVVLSGSVTGGKRRPIGVMTGFILSFTFFTLFLTSLVRAVGISADALRLTAVVIVLLFGLSYLIPSLQRAVEIAFSRIATFAPQRSQEDGFVSGLLVGVSLGLVWTPCVGPILASIIAIAATSAVGLGAVVVTFSYALGTAIPLIAIIYSGRKLLDTHPWLIANSETIQKVFGTLMILTAIAIYMNWDRRFQAYVLEKFPNYGTGLTKLEDNALVKRQLDKLKNPSKLSLADLLEGNFADAPELISGGKWFNSQPLTLKSLRGKVVVIDFWTYTCINCIRTLPYTKSWWDKYKDRGLVFIGVHTPEFEFEKNPDNVARAIKDFTITYPVMQDNNYATWNAYNNQYWPAEYFIDKNGKIRFTHFGEGNYDESEKHIQELLAETGVTDQPAISNKEYQIYARSPETYLGQARGDYTNIQTTGNWTRSDEFAMPQTGATLTYHFNAKNVYLVMRPHKQGVSAKVSVLLDGKKINQIIVDADRLYTLVELPTPGDHIVELDFLDDNVELYAFTFG